MDLPPGLPSFTDHPGRRLELSELDVTEPVQGLVVRSTAGFVDVRVGAELLQARIRGRLKHTPRTTDLCVIGDQVMVAHPGKRTFVVVEVLPRTTRFSRRQPGRGPKREDVLVANLDQLMITFCYGRPLLNKRLLDRFLVIAEHQYIQPVIVMN
ncbi:MAG: GTPase RsgA, partial [Myxococcales bacterium]